MNYASDRFILFVYIPDVRGYGVLFVPAPSFINMV